jgi:hypothetical protein
VSIFSHVPRARSEGVDEGGTVVSTPTVMHAILTALAPLGRANLTMPARPERIWRAMRVRTRMTGPEDQIRPLRQKPVDCSVIAHQSAAQRARE